MRTCPRDPSPLCVLTPSTRERGGGGEREEGAARGTPTLPAPPLPLPPPLAPPLSRASPHSRRGARAVDRERPGPLRASASAAEEGSPFGRLCVHRFFFAPGQGPALTLTETPPAWGPDNGGARRGSPGTGSGGRRAGQRRRHGLGSGRGRVSRRLCVAQRCGRRSPPARLARGAHRRSLGPLVPHGAARVGPVPCGVSDELRFFLVVLVPQCDPPDLFARADLKEQPPEASDVFGGLGGDLPLAGEPDVPKPDASPASAPAPKLEPPMAPLVPDSARPLVLTDAATDAVPDGTTSPGRAREATTATKATSVSARAASAAGTSVATRSDSAEKTHKKQLALQEKNRRAQRRFRERQKQKARIATFLSVGSRRESGRRKGQDRSGRGWGAGGVPAVGRFGEKGEGGEEVEE